jgi:hypothetical protein
LGSHPNTHANLATGHRRCHTRLPHPITSAPYIVGWTRPPCVPWSKAVAVDLGAGSHLSKQQLWCCEPSPQHEPDPHQDTSDPWYAARCLACPASPTTQPSRLAASAGCKPHMHDATQQQVLTQYQTHPVIRTPMQPTCNPCSVVCRGRTASTLFAVGAWLHMHACVQVCMHQRVLFNLCCLNLTSTSSTGETALHMHACRHANKPRSTSQKAPGQQDGHSRSMFQVPRDAAKAAAANRIC